MSATSKLENNRLTFTTNGTTIATRLTASADTLTLVGNAAANVTIGGIANPTTAQQAATKGYVDGLVTGAALTKVDDTNVTLALGGTPTTALLRAVSITAGWSGTLGVSRGGTGTGSAPTNGQLLIGNGTNYTLNTLSATGGLAITNGSGTSSVGFTPSIIVTYLAVAGGGSGGNAGGGGGGGGAGGMIATTQTITASTVLTTSVGAGATGSTGNGTNGSDSTISGTGFTTVTAIGGGGGGAVTVGAGGSGGGGGIAATTGGLGTVGQGNNGGNYASSAAGGGGGAGAVGVTGGTGGAGAGGSGGVGLSNTITGSTVIYAGGGGGGGTGSAGAGGNGGGGAGNTGVGATSGTANTGGGGGGCAGGTSGAGGSGIVIIRIPTAAYGGFTGTGTATTVGFDTVVRLTAGSGSVTITIPSTSKVITNDLSVSGNLAVAGSSVTTGTITTGSYITAVQPYGYALGNGSQTINNNSSAVVSGYWTTPTISNGGLTGGMTYSGGLYTIPISGVYIITCMVSWQTNGSGTRVLDVLQNSGTVRLARSETPGSSVSRLCQIVTTTIFLQASVTVGITLFQDSGSNIALDNSIAGNFCITKIS